MIINKRFFLISVLAIIAVLSQAQEHLPRFKYSLQPAVIKGRVISNSIQDVDDVRVRCTMKYHSGTGDALRGKKASLDENGCFSLDLPTRTPVYCMVFSDDFEFSCIVIPGDTVSFTLDLDKLKSKGLTKSLVFDGQLTDFNHDFVYAQENNFDPKTLYQEIERKRNTSKLINELPSGNEDGYYQYLDSTYRRVNELIDEDKEIGTAYKEFAKAVNIFEYGSMLPFCAQAIKYADLDTDEKYAAFSDRQRRRVEKYIQDNPWDSPVLCYHMGGMPDYFISKRISHPVELPEDFFQCNLATKYMMQIAQQSQLLSEAQKDSVKTFMPVLGQDVMAFNEKKEQELSFINEQGMSRICTLSDDQILSNDVLSALLKPYHGRPVLLDLWETTCGPCRFAFKEMHEKKVELADRIHFVNVASERSDLETWERLVPSYIGDHYRLTEKQLQALHSQLPCDTNSVPIWVLVNADGSIHHAFIGWGNIEMMMEELDPVLAPK